MNAVADIALDLIKKKDARILELEAALRRALDICDGSGADFTWQAQEDLRELRLMLEEQGKA